MTGLTCVTNDERYFGRIMRSNNWKRIMSGFGEPEAKYDAKIAYLKKEPKDDVKGKEEMTKDIMMACDRNLDQKLNFNE